MENEYLKLERLEQELADAGTRKSIKRLARLLADDFEEVGKSGRIFTKKDLLSMLTTEKYQKIVLNDFRFRPLSETSILVKYQSHCEGLSAYRSSIWIKESNEWRLLYHQGTLQNESPI